LIWRNVPRPEWIEARLGFPERPEPIVKNNDLNPLPRILDLLTGRVLLMGKNAKKDESEKRFEERLNALHPLDRLVVSMMLELKDVELREKNPEVAETKKRLIEQRYEAMGQQSTGKSVEQRRRELSEQGRQLLSRPKNPKP